MTKKRLGRVFTRNVLFYVFIFQVVFYLVDRNKCQLYSEHHEAKSDMLVMNGTFLLMVQMTPSVQGGVVREPMYL